MSPSRGAVGREEMSTRTARCCQTFKEPKATAPRSTAPLPGIMSIKEKSEIQMVNPNSMTYQHEEQVQTSHSGKNRPRPVEVVNQQVLRVQRVEVSHTEEIQDSDTTQQPQSPQRPTHSSRGRPLKRKCFPDEEIPKKKLQSLETDLVQSSKHVSTIRESKRAAGAERQEKDDLQKQLHERPLEARVVVQQCSSAKVKTRAGVDGAESQYAQIREGLVVYVCFFEGATDETTQRIADSVMNTRFFRASFRRQLLSVLDLPGSVLLVPQESLGYEPGPRRSMQNRGVSEAWLGKRLFSSLVQHCSELLRAKGTEGGVVEQGLYGQRQELEIASTDPTSHVLEF
ncbi:hypothetical protein WMY93_016550 [Mugilogobius chulae]|uniref:D-aminoacyl-tRNA deacylase n=1 Tax=Mugilogobius chulae TaxID=88201 RepID=A0AAW0NLV1_9GOBI